MKKPLLLLLIAVCAMMAFGHEFWLSPNKFFFRIRDVATIRFRVGENFPGENWHGNRERVQRLEHSNPSGALADITSLLSSASGDSIRLPLSEEGTHMVLFNSSNSFISLPADSFNTYLKTEGLDEALAYRRSHGEIDQKGTEYYQRSVKTIFQAGTKTTDACLQPVFLPLDIVPERNPYAVPAGTDRSRPIKLRFRVLFNGEPMDNILVNIWHYDTDGKTVTENLRTSKRGWVTITRYSGPCLISCVYMQRAGGPKAQWQSYWASLSFEFSKFFPRKSAA